jgi:hypothetical protein
LNLFFIPALFVLVEQLRGLFSRKPEIAAEAAAGE